MRLHEHEGKALLRDYGVAVPAGSPAGTREEAVRIATDLGAGVVVKAQVLAGGRGKAGGILVADSPEDAGRCAAQLLTSDVRGCRPEEVLVEERLDISREIYLGITVDGAAGRPAAVVSAEGGVEIETVAAVRPEALASVPVDPIEGMSGADAEGLVRQAGLKGEVGRAVAGALLGLYRLFAECEALIAEINPLAVLGDGSVAAVDAVVEVDDAAQFRHPAFRDRAAARPTGPRERAARELGMTFVELDGDIGLICSGAGLGMATMDLIAQRAQPANFLETGGGITRELMAEAMRIVLDRPGLRGVLINIYGGINPIHEGAKGIADVMGKGVPIPVVAKALGNFQEQTWATLEAAGVTVVKEIETEAAVAALLDRLDGRPGSGSRG